METLFKDLEGKTIVAIDDKKINTLIITKMLSARKAKVIEYNSGQTALQKIPAISNDVDLILLDILMPITDGYEVVKTLKNNPVTKDIPVVMLSALAAEEDIHKALTLGANGYMTKPIIMERLYEIVDNHIR